MYAWILAWYTIFIIYNGLCSLCYMTDFLKDSCLSCISPSNNKDTKMWASVLLPENFNIFIGI